MTVTKPDALLAEINDRMSVFLDDVDADAWIGAGPLPDDRPLSLCATYPPPARKITKRDSVG